MEQKPWVCPYCKQELIPRVVQRATNLGDGVNHSLFSSPQDGNCPQRCDRQVRRDKWEMDRDNFNNFGHYEA